MVVLLTSGLLPDELGPSDNASGTLNGSSGGGGQREQLRRLGTERHVALLGQLLEDRTLSMRPSVAAKILSRLSYIMSRTSRSSRHSCSGPRTSAGRGPGSLTGRQRGCPDHGTSGGGPHRRAAEVADSRKQKYEKICVVELIVVAPERPDTVMSFRELR